MLQNVQCRKNLRAASRLLSFLDKHLDQLAHVNALATLYGRGLPHALRQEHAQMRAYLDVMRQSFVVWGADEHVVWVSGRLLGNCLISHVDKVERAMRPPKVARAVPRRCRPAHTAVVARCPLGTPRSPLPPEAKAVM
jgi:hypothetical protein